MSTRIQRVSPFHRTSQFADSEEFDFRVWLSPGLSDAVEGSTSGALSLHRETKFIIGLDFAVTLSSPDSSGVLFDIPSEQSVELKWLMLNKHKRCFHSSRVKFPLVSMSASWFLVSMYLIWIFGSNLIRSKNPVKSNSVGPGNLSHCGTSSLFNHLDHCFVVFKHIQQSFLIRKLDVWGNKVNIIQNIEHSSKLHLRVTCVTANNGFHRSIMVLSRVSKNCNDQIP